MKLAEFLSPVQRVMSIQSSDWFKSVRRWASEGSGRGVVVLGFRVRVVGGCVLSLSWICW